MRRSALLHLALGALLLAGVAPAGASAATGDAELAEAQPSVSTSGRFSVVEHGNGSTIVWRPATEIPHGDARVELAIDGQPVRAPLTRLADGTFALSLPGTTGLTPRQISAVAAGRVLEGAGAQGGAKRSVPTKVSQPTRLVKSDPGAKGRHKTTAFTYSQPRVRVGDFPIKTEVQARVVLPAKTAKGKRPLAVFLHGRHATCYSADGEESIDWPCGAGFRKTPSFRGYEYAQKLLASQGYATVSISANGINGQDFAAPDGGAAARGELIEHHLKLLAGWSSKGGQGDLGQLEGRLDLKKVVLVGFSRGGEGANQATMNLSGKASPVVRGQVLVAPTDFGRQVSPGVPTSVILPYCDGDVYDLEGQAYVDQGRYVTPQDKAHKSAIMMLGANHNYFNTEWTPGISKAPSHDDWFDAADPTCGAQSKHRLTPKQQRAAGSTYIAAAVKSFLTRDTDATRLLDGSPVRARSAGKAVVLSSGFTGKRHEVVSAASAIKLKTSKGISAEVCADGSSRKHESCWGFAPFGLSPHWLTDGNPAVAPWSRAVAVSWSTKGARLRITPKKVRNLKSARRLDLRVATSGAPTAPRFDVVLTDVKGRTLTLTPERHAQDLPGLGGMDQRVWAQTVRVEIPKKPKKLNLAKVRSLTIKTTSSKGEIFLLDAFTSRTAQPKFTRGNSRVPRFEVSDVSGTVEETPSGTKTFDVTVRAKRNEIRASRLAVTIATPDGGQSQKVVSVPAGRSSFTVPVTVTADGVYGPEGPFWAWAPSYVAVSPLRNAVATDPLGMLELTHTTPPPDMTFPSVHVEVEQGESVVWPLRLSGLVDGLVSVSGLFVAPEGGLPELTSANVPLSYFSALGIPTPTSPTAISETGLVVTTTLDPHKSTGSLELPTRALPPLTKDAHVQVIVFPDGVHVREPVVLTATIKPAS